MFFLEAFAVILSLAYIICVSRGYFIAWWFGLGGALLYVGVFYKAGLFASAGLSVVFAAFMVYGLINWYGQKGHGPVRKLTRMRLASAVMAGAMASGLIHWGCVQFLDPNFVVFDSCIAGFSCIAQFLVAKKYLDCWYFWIAINLVAVGLYTLTGLYMSGILYSIYLVLAFYGIYSWRCLMAQKAESGRAKG